ncbi:antibiotic biosynthesis monooxygenase [Candidatus Uabimicrobium sp. HlEnr_7]|uniref:antibiotic biosynthesis monooxygenase family protein n=1 Tax=Candidatus Uabimicrobium helgolandensis TaxID=3095367 RepID=UPI0035586528
MYVAMNRFQVREESSADFEKLWRERDSHLEKVPGFLQFHLLRGDLNEENVRLYSSYTTWKTKTDFENWTKSEHFKNTHKNAKMPKGTYVSHPKFEGFDTLFSIN